MDRQVYDMREADTSTGADAVLSPPQLRAADTEQGRENMYVELNIGVWRVGLNITVSMERPRLKWNLWSNQHAVGLEAVLGFVAIGVTWEK